MIPWAPAPMLALAGIGSPLRFGVFAEHRIQVARRSLTFRVPFSLNSSGLDLASRRAEYPAIRSF